MKILIRISFLGTSFYGTQKQSDKKTIQGDFESLLSRVYDEKVKVTISSRLDRGVHALDFALTFDVLNDPQLSGKGIHGSFHEGHRFDGRCLGLYVKRQGSDFR